MSRSIKVVNRSNWPTWLIKWLVSEACKDAGVKRYDWTQKSISDKPGNLWWGRGGQTYGYGAAVRRGIRSRPGEMYPVKDGRFVDAPIENVPHTPVALLAFLIRHEVAHARDAEACPRDYKKTNGHINRVDMEDAANEAGGIFVRRLHAEWPRVLAEWKKLARKQRELERAQRERRKTAKADKNAMLLSYWERRLSLAKTKVKKYTQRVRAQERRAAARSN